MIPAQGATRALEHAALTALLALGAFAAGCQHATTTADAPMAPPELDGSGASPSPTPTPHEPPTPRPTRLPEADDPAPANERDASDGPDAETAAQSEEPARNAWIDRFNRQVHSGVKSAARWFDGFFGNPRAFEDAYTTYGSLAIRVHWTEYEGFDEELRGRGEVQLPNLDRRWRAFIGRLDEDDYLTYATDQRTIAEQMRRRDRDEEILLGLGFSPMDAGRQRFDLGGGVRIDWPPEPYVRGRYRTYYNLGAQSLLRLRQTAFWRLDDGFGVSTSADVEQRVDPTKVLRLAGRGTLSETSDGVDWWSSVTLYQALSGDHALAWHAWINGETDDPVPVEEYGVRVLNRRRIYREWLFLESGVEISWPRRHLREEREPSWGIIVGVEMQVGLNDTPPPRP